MTDTFKIKSMENLEMKARESDLNNIFKLPSDNEGMTKPLNPVITNADLVCNHISFAYNQDSAVLKTKVLKVRY